MREVCAEPYVQYTSNVQRTVCATEETTESRIAVSNTFQRDMGKRSTYQPKSRRRRRFVRCTAHPSRSLKAIW